MTNAQTEARAIVAAILVDERLAVGYQIETLADAIVEHIATALTAKDAELAAANDAWRAMKDRAHAAEAQLAEANRKIAERDKALANYDRWLDGRDAYIVQKGLWQNFVASLPGSPTARRALEAQGGE